MKLWLFSDLHLEVAVLQAPLAIPDADVCVAAGDLCRAPANGVHWLAENIAHAMPCVYVAGNHEFYGHTFGEELLAGRERARQLGVHFLENEATVQFGYLRIIGCTLWTDYALFGESLREAAMRHAYDIMRDHKRIKLSRRPWRRFRPQDARMLHLQSCAFLEAELSKTFDGTTIVLTHMAPTIEAIEPLFRDRTISAAYASNLLSMIDRHQPHFWISGHTHHSMDLLQGRTRLISNPCGYASENSMFDPQMTIDVAP